MLGEISGSTMSPRGRAGRLRTAGVALSLSAVASLAACTSGSSGGTEPGTSSAAADGSGSSAPTSSTATSAPAVPAVITSSITRAKGLSPATPITVGIAHGTLTTVTMINPEGKKVAGALNATATSWHNTVPLGYSKTYRITATGKNAAGAAVTKQQTVSTLTPDNMTMPNIDTIYGSEMKNNATYGVGMVVRVAFDEQVDRAKAEKALKVVTSPSVTGSWYWQDNSNVYWRPKTYYTPGTKVQVEADVYGREVGDGLYGQADKAVSFTIGAKHVAIADAKTHHVKVYSNDKLVRNMPTSMGQGGTTQGKNGPIYLWTMPGTYTVINFENPATMSSDSYGLPANSPLGYAPEQVPWATKISTDGIYLHELDTTLSQQGHENVSHGCLNLNQANAKWYFQHSRLGDVVHVVHSGGPAITFDQGGQWSVPWSEWVKHSALN